MFVVDALNGVICSPNTLIANLIGWIEYSNIDFPSTLENKVAIMTTTEKQQLLNKVNEFWSIGTISDIEQRMKEVNLIIFR